MASEFLKTVVDAVFLHLLESWREVLRGGYLIHRMDIKSNWIVFLSGDLRSSDACGRVRVRVSEQWRDVKQAFLPVVFAVVGAWRMDAPTASESDSESCQKDGHFCP